MKVLKQSHIPAGWSENTLTLKVHQENRIADAVTLLVHAGIGIHRIYEQQMSLEDIFLHLTGKKVSL